jgi:hypothetical protein
MGPLFLSQAVLLVLEDHLAAQRGGATFSTWLHQARDEVASSAEAGAAASSAQHASSGAHCGTSARTSGPIGIADPLVLDRLFPCAKGTGAAAAAAAAAAAVAAAEAVAAAASDDDDDDDEEEDDEEDGGAEKEDEDNDEDDADHIDADVGDHSDDGYGSLVGALGGLASLSSSPTSSSSPAAASAAFASSQAAAEAAGVEPQRSQVLRRNDGFESLAAGSGAGGLSTSVVGACYDALRVVQWGLFTRMQKKKKGCARKWLVFYTRAYGHQ